ncbi:hypothetical protein B0J14DRAFT_707410 [Halenospora varia]|nr:hypothetical protein B0J14DRAFT_707410 [Halenospora varia]
MLSTNDKLTMSFGLAATTISIIGVVVAVLTRPYRRRTRPDVELGESIFRQNTGHEHEIVLRALDLASGFVRSRDH